MMPLDGFARCFELFGALFWRFGGRAALVIHGSPREFDGMRSTQAMAVVHTSETGRVAAWWQPPGCFSCLLVPPCIPVAMRPHKSSPTHHQSPQRNAPFDWAYQKHSRAKLSALLSMGPRVGMGPSSYPRSSFRTRRATVVAGRWTVLGD